MTSTTDSPFVTPSSTLPRPSGPAASVPFAPALAGAQRGVPPPKLASRPAALLMAHQERWGVEGGRLRPILGTLTLQAGIDGITEEGGRLRIGDARINREERGWTIIPPETLPPSQAHRGQYLTALADRPDVRLFYWQSAFAGSAEIRRDDALYYEWLDYVVASGAVPPCQDYVIDTLIERAEAGLLRAQDKARVHPSALPMIDRLTAELGVLRKERERRQAERACEPPEVPAQTVSAALNLGDDLPRKARR